MTIDPTKPMYDSDGREWVALRMPDGSVWRRDDGAFVANCDDKQTWTVSAMGEGIWHDGLALSNTKPQKDWSHTTVARDFDTGNHDFLIRYGVRNHVAFAEAVKS